MCVILFSPSEIILFASFCAISCYASSLLSSVVATRIYCKMFYVCTMRTVLFFLRVSEVYDVLLQLSCVQRAAVY